jgi:hypothetical protein
MNMNRTTTLAACLLAISLAAGCAQTNVDNRESAVASEIIAKPARAIVYDFASTPTGIPPDSALAGLYRERTTPQTPEEIALGRSLGAKVSARLVEELNKSGIAATAAATGPVPLLGDAVIRGEFVTIDKGGRGKRMLIGFGAGSNELHTLVEGYVVTTGGLVPLGSAQIEASGGKTPGMLVPLAVGVATGSVARSLVISGTTSVLKELGPESLDGAAKRTAKEIAKVIVKAYKERGWL